jgi:hypothetical protein
MLRASWKKTVGTVGELKSADWWVEVHKTKHRRDE